MALTRSAKQRTIVWFRGKDLRLSDNLPLQYATARGEVLPLFVLDPECLSRTTAEKRPHHTQFLLDSLHCLEEQLRQRNSRLLVVAGNPQQLIPRLVLEWEAHEVVAQREAAPLGRQCERNLTDTLGPKLLLFDGETLLPPGRLRTVQGKPYAVFTPFARSLVEALKLGRPSAAPRQLPKIPRAIPRSNAKLPSFSDLGVSPNSALQTGGEVEAKARLQRFLRRTAEAYADHRDRMDLSGTSRLSADLKFGTLSPRRVWASVQRAVGNTRSGRSFLNELAWREFAYSTVWDRPQVLQQPFRPGFADFPWEEDETAWGAWTVGQTGYPIVDAAARQLLRQGFVHNRARMISASFLTKHLLIDYRRGEAHYLRHLTDGDSAPNNAGWQWSAGCGCDAQPYFRVFNPMTQGNQFDPTGDYVRQWLPELSHLPTSYIHQPWVAPAAELARAHIRLGQSYPHPIVDHRFARERFLARAKAHLSRKAPEPKARARGLDTEQ